MIVEIRAAEGGDDAKSLVREQLELYRRYLKRNGFSLELIEDLPGQISFSAPPEASYLFADESGGHRWQRVPPNEKRGRVHTSTVTVAVLPELDRSEFYIDCDVEFRYDRGTGPGGQNKNKVETRVTATYVPTGTKVVCDVERTQGQNKRLALSLLRSRVYEEKRRREQARSSHERKLQVGSGMRGDKRRTIRTQDGIVTDHLLKKRWPLKMYLEGRWR